MGTKLVVSSNRMTRRGKGWMIEDRNGKRYRKYLKSSTPNRAVVFTSSVKWQVIFIVINIALVLILLKII